MERKLDDFMNALSSYTTVLFKGEINTELAQAMAQYKLAYYKIKYSQIFSLISKEYTEPGKNDK